MSADRSMHFYLSAPYERGTSISPPLVQGGRYGDEGRVAYVGDQKGVVWAFTLV